MDGLAGVTSISTLNGMANCGDLFAGRLVAAKYNGAEDEPLEDAEMALPIARLLPRSATSLTQLTLRCPPIAAHCRN